MYKCQSEAASGSDSDGNSFTDAWEIEHYGAIGLVDGSADSDGDGVKDFFEYLYDSDPKDAASRGFRLEARPDEASSAILFEWAVADPFVLGTDYRVAISTDLVDWEPLPPENYTIEQNSQEGRTFFELTLTHNYGDHAFIKLEQIVESE